MITPAIDAGTAKLCAYWWAERFQIDDKRVVFREELERRLVTGEVDDRDRREAGIFLEVDYDPRGTLLEIVRWLGIKCCGFLCSADGILPRKRRMWICNDGSVEVQDGRVSPVWLVPRPEVI